MGFMDLSDIVKAVNSNYLCRLLLLSYIYATAIVDIDLAILISTLLIAFRFLKFPNTILLTSTEPASVN